jgi:hypothetical protein
VLAGSERGDAYVNRGYSFCGSGCHLVAFTTVPWPGDEAI